MRVVPVYVASGHFAFAGKQGQKADAVAFLYRIVMLHTGYFENGGEEVLYHQIMVAFGFCGYRAGPAYNHRFAHPAFVGGTFSAVERVVLHMQLSGTGVRGQPAVIGHEKQDGVIGEIILIQIVHQVAEAFVHTLYQCGIRRFYRGKTFVQILLVETHIGLDRSVYGVMSHV